jgi:excisionase family DNA binding protein
MEMSENEATLRKRKKWPINTRALVFTLREAAYLMEVAPRTINRMIKLGQLRPVRIRGSRRRGRLYIRRDDVNPKVP